MSLPSHLVALVIDEELRVAKNNKLYLQITIRTRVGNIRCFMWSVSNDAATNPSYPHAGDIIELDAYKDQMQERQSIVIDAFHRITKESISEEDQVIFAVDKASDEDMQAAFALLKDNSFWENPNHHKFAMACLGKLDLDRFKICPAAHSVHHSYLGGLVVHSAEVLSLCKAYVETTGQRYNFITKDVLYASAILHDVGKLQSYEVNEAGIARLLVTEKIIGHMHYAMCLVQNVASEGKIPIEQSFVNETVHCIASHHGNKEYGSIVEPRSIEAGVLSRMDYLSSRNGMMEKVLKESVQSGQPLQEDFRIYSDPYFASMGIRKYVEEKGIDAAVSF